MINLIRMIKVVQEAIFKKSFCDQPGQSDQCDQNTYKNLSRIGPMINLISMINVVQEAIKKSFCDQPSQSDQCDLELQQEFE